MSSTIDDKPNQLSSCPIQRLIIFHTDLPKACGVELGESAGISEISEQILFYHPAIRYDNEEAVQFMSLCSGLYTLPNSISDEEKDDYTREIFFQQSTLVFIRLEDGIVLVVQIARIFSSSSSGGGNPLAARTSLGHSHKVFQFFRGGTILHRLSQRTKQLEQEDNCPFPGMKQLYQLQKKIRKWKESSSPDKEQEILSLSQKIQSLRESLSIQSIRRDLEAHYKEYLGNLSLVTSRQGGGLRCLVECIPIPLDESASRNIDLTNLQAHLQHFIHEIDVRELLGISCFCQGQLLYTQKANYPDELDQMLSNETLRVIMGYLASFRNRIMTTSPSISSSHSSPQQNPPPLLNFWTLSLGAKNPNSSYIQPVPPSRGYFLPPPPAYMLSSSEGESEYLELTVDLQPVQVWAPIVHLPSKKSSHSFVARVVLLQVQDFSFLLFLDHKTKTSNAVSNALLTVQDRLSRVVAAEEYLSSKASWKDPGMDLVLVDRPKHKVILVSDHREYNKSSDHHSTTNPPPLRFLGFGGPPKQTRHNHNINDAQFQVEWSTLGMDGRHLLASKLHLDVLLALDDMASEIHHAKALCKTQLELCTCMTLGWVYASLTNDKEMYAFFDSSIYVTVADVQQAVQKIKLQYLGEEPAT